MHTYAQDSLLIERFLKIILAILIGLTIMVDVMNAPSHELTNLKKQVNAFKAGINALEAQGLTEWAVQMAVHLRAELAKVEARVAELEAKV